MSRAEITAWQMGVDLERAVHDANPDGDPDPDPMALVLTDAQVAARDRLGPDLFSRWVAKGAADALAERQKGGAPGAR